MNLTTYLKEIGKGACSWAAAQKLPVSRISQHVQHEESGGKGGRALGRKLSLKVAGLTEGRVRFSDLRPDLAEELAADLAEIKRLDAIGSSPG